MARVLTMRVTIAMNAQFVRTDASTKVVSPCWHARRRLGISTLLKMCVWDRQSSPTCDSTRPSTRSHLCCVSVARIFAVDDRIRRLGSQRQRTHRSHAQLAREGYHLLDLSQLNQTAEATRQSSNRYHPHPTYRRRRPQPIVDGGGDPTQSLISNISRCLLRID